MKRNKLMLSILAAAALGAFGTVNAHEMSSSSEASAEPTLAIPSDSSLDTSPSIGSGDASLGSDSSVSSSASVDSSTDIGSSGDMAASDSNASADDAHAGASLESEASSGEILAMGRDEHNPGTY